MKNSSGDEALEGNQPQVTPHEMSRFEKTPLELRDEIFVLDDVADRVALVLLESATHKGIAFDWEVEPVRVPSLQGDADCLAQIVAILVSNAIRFTARGSVKLGIRVEATEHGPVVCLDVVDTGVGIVSTLQTQIFAPEFKTSISGATKEQSHRGGLSICRQIVTAMQGLMGVESVEGKGSRFWVRLPLRYAGENAPVAHDAPTRVETDWRTRNIRVLVVEDDAANRYVATRMLQLLGAEVVSVDNGVSALLSLQEHVFDAVLMDLSMPKMNGIETVRQWRAIETRKPHVPIIAFTANTSSTDREAAHRAGMDDFLAKPVTLDMLRQTLERNLSSKSHSLRPLPIQELPPSPLDQETLDLSAIIELGTFRKPGGDDPVLEVCSVFQHDTTCRLAEMRQAHQREQTAEVVRIAHTMRGACGYFGTHRLVRILQGIENSPAISIHAYGAMIDEVASELDRVFKRLDAWMKNREAFE